MRGIAEIGLTTRCSGLASLAAELGIVRPLCLLRSLRCVAVQAARRCLCRGNADGFVGSVKQNGDRVVFAPSKVSRLGGNLHGLAVLARTAVRHHLPSPRCCDHRSCRAASGRAWAKSCRGASLPSRQVLVWALGVPHRVTLTVYGHGQGSWDARRASPAPGTVPETEVVGLGKVIVLATWAVSRKSA